MNHLCRFPNGLNRSVFAARASNAQIVDLHLVRSSLFAKSPLVVKEVSCRSELKGYCDTLQIWRDYIEVLAKNRDLGLGNLAGHMMDVRLKDCDSIAHGIGAMLEMMKDDFPMRQELFAPRACVCTRAGRLQAVAVWMYARNETIEVCRLVASPWNSAPWDSPWKAKGAGTCLMKEIIARGIRENKTLTLTAYHSAVEFYKNLGFIPGVGSSFSLPPEATLVQQREGSL